MAEPTALQIYATACYLRDGVWPSWETIAFAAHEGLDVAFEEADEAVAEDARTENPHSYAQAGECVPPSGHRSRRADFRPGDRLDTSDVEGLPRSCQGRRGGMPEALDRLVDRYPYLADVTEADEPPARSGSSNTGRTPRPPTPRVAAAAGQQALAKRFPALRTKIRRRRS